MKKRWIAAALAGILTFSALTGCSSASSQLEAGSYEADTSTTQTANNAAPEASELSALAGAVTESVVPGNFSFYDYFADVYGFDKSTAAKVTVDGEEKDYYFSVRNHLTVNERSADFPVYHPFSTLLYEEFQFLLQSSQEEDLGYYAVVFGGEWEEGTQAALTAVRDAAAVVASEKTPPAAEDLDKAGYSQDYLPVIYNFDFKLNGGLEIEDRLQEYGFTANPDGEYNTDIREDMTSFGTNANKSSTTALYKRLYTTLDVGSFFADAPSVTVLSSSTTENPDGTKTYGDLDITDTSSKYISSPSIILLRKEINADGELVNTVLNFIDLSTDPASKQSEIEDLLRSATAATDAQGNVIPEGFQQFDFFRYIWGSYTQGSGTSLTGSFGPSAGSFTNTFSGEALNVQYDNLTDKDHIYRTVTYAELVHILQLEGNYPIYFGGSWCHYSRGFLAPFNEIAKTYYVSEVYVFDPYIDGTSSSTNIRSSEGSGLFTRLYANLLTYFGVDYRSYGFPTEYDSLSNWFLEQRAEGNAFNFSGDEDLRIGGKKLTKIGVPTLIGYNKDNVDADGNPAPLFGSASTQAPFEDIVAAAEEPHKGVDDPVAVGEDGVAYYEHVNYLSVARTSLGGRIAEYNAMKFLDNFLKGELTYRIVT